MNIFKKGISFLKEVRQELAKVSWASRQELKDSTIVVVVITGITTLFIGTIDLLLSKILSVIFK